MEDMNLKNDTVAEEEFHAEPLNETTDNEEKIDVDALTEEEAKTILKEVLQSNDEIVKELEKTQLESEKFKDSWYRTTAEFENYKKRNQDIRKNSYQDGKIDAINNILLIGDSLDRALSMNMDDTTRQGVQLIQKQFVESMQALGVEVIDPLGETFSPEFSEAIATVDKTCDAEVSGTIKQVFKKGYKLNGKTIRYAQVVVIN